MALNLYTEAELLAELGRRLRDQRLRRNLLQKTLAEKAGISVSALKKLEGQGTGSLENFMKVVYALRLEKELQSLFVPQPLTIAQLEALRAPARQRARKATRPRKIARESNS
ncbi:helix-turn-helix domain-containing protein [Cedecea colo]|uniref:DNA-binding protein n=1 Tax=Cedecea colo TaxID=2552946 RepID=A0ABX0VJZ7_9ENTR|nr:DNA-binding protein [Cedecea colo]